MNISDHSEGLFLYFDPTIYMPYDLSLRKKDALVLDEMWVEHGERIDVEKYSPRPKRQANNNFIQMRFNKPLHMNVGPLNGVDEGITLVMKYTVRFPEQRPVKVAHRQHVIIRKRSISHNLIRHYSTRTATPAFFGAVSGKRINNGVFMYGDSVTSKVLQFGIMEGTKDTWAIESMDLLYPDVELRHGTVH